jgi:hypothetical protein
MINQTSPPPPFWPSRHLWLKFFIGSIYMPILLVLLMWVFFKGLFSPSSEQVLYAIPFVLILIGGPVSVGLMLAPSWRGVGAGLLAIVMMIITWNLIGQAGLQNLPPNIGESLGFTLISATGVIALEFIVRDIDKPSKLGELAIGILAGFLLSLLFVSIFSPYSPRFDIPSEYSTEFGIVGWAVQFSLVWLSAFFFPEWLSRKVGWGGVVVWTALVSATLGLSLALMK